MLREGTRELVPQKMRASIRMVTILVPVDGSKPSDHAIEHLIELAANGLKANVMLINVQAGARTRSRTHKRVQTVADFDAAERATRSAVALLEKAGMSFRRYTRFGAPADAILKFATQKRCDQIVMGTRGLGAVAGLVLGSVAVKILQLAEIPVTLVK